jgi:TolB protein
MRRLVVISLILLCTLSAGCSTRRDAPTGTPEGFPERPTPGGPLVFDDTIVYTCDLSGNRDLFVLEGRGEPVRLTDTPQDEIAPVWSPDGSRIAFGRREDDNTVDLWVISADGKDERRIYDSGSAYLNGIAWHPNGEIIYFGRGYFDGASTMGQKIAMLSPDDPDTQPALLVDPFWDQHNTYSYPAVTLDGSMIAFSHYERFALPFLLDIYVGRLSSRGIAATHIVQLTEDDTRDANPAWSPDGTALAWERETAKESGEFNVWVMDADGGAKTQVTSQPGQQVEPVWSSHGLALIYASDESGSFQLYMRHAWGDGEGLRLTDNEANNLSPDVRPLP